MTDTEARMREILEADIGPHGNEDVMLHNGITWYRDGYVVAQMLRARNEALEEAEEAAENCDGGDDLGAYRAARAIRQLKE